MMLVQDYQEQWLYSVQYGEKMGRERAAIWKQNAGIRIKIWIKTNKNVSRKCGYRSQYSIRTLSNRSIAYGDHDLGKIYK